jgi:hypothetical protein
MKVDQQNNQLNNCSSPLLKREVLAAVSELPLTDCQNFGDNSANIHKRSKKKCVAFHDNTEDIYSLKYFIFTDDSMKERIIKKGNRNKPKTMILAIAAIGIMTFVMLDISTLQEIKAQPIFPGSQQITKTPATHTPQLPKQKVQHPSVSLMIHL